MNEEIRLDEAKRLIAETLHEGGFGEDPGRNWFMASMLMAEADFRRLCEASEVLIRRGDIPDLDHATTDLWRRIAHVIYETSLGLSVPSLDPYVNWDAAKRILPILPQVLELLAERD